MYLFRDQNGDGDFSSDEEIAKSISSDSSEKIEQSELSDGLYGIAVLGYDVPGGTMNFQITIQEFGGDDLRITNQISLSKSEINSIWPDGSMALANEDPAAAVQVSLEFDRPESAGTWQGYVEIELNGSIKFQVPYVYELLELPPAVNFSSPENMSHHNSSTPIEIYAIDTGIGFKLDQVKWLPRDNNTIIPNATSVNALDTQGNHHNLTTLWNHGNHSAIQGNITLREIWINSSLPQIEQWHDYVLSVTDHSGFSTQAFLSLSFDRTAPDVMISQIPEITSNQVMTYRIWTEPSAIFTHSGSLVELDEEGFAEHSFLLQDAEVGFDDSTGVPYYFVEGTSIFEVSVSDAAGNTVSRQFQVVYDPEPPGDVKFETLYDQEGNPYQSSHLVEPVNLTNGNLVLKIPSDTMDWCLSIDSVSDDYSTLECGSMVSRPAVFNTSTGHPEPDEKGGAQEKFTISLPLETTGLPDGEYGINLELMDWTNNSASQSWLIHIDKTIPSIDWDLSMANSLTLFEHRQDLSWSSSEPVTFEFTMNGEILTSGLSSSGTYSFEIPRTGSHELCLYAVDGTLNRNNNNHALDCRFLSLNESVYDTLVLANWNGGIVPYTEVMATVQLGPGQEITWSRHASEETNLLLPESDVETISFELEEGENRFSLLVGSLDQIDIYELSVVRDTIPPIINIEERTNRTSTLSRIRVIEGTCESGTNTLVWSDVDSVSVICPPNGAFSIQLAILNTPGKHTINVISTDHANNEASAEIEVLMQNWPEWAIDDARNMGPMLIWFSIAGLMVLTSTVLAVRRLSRVRIEMDTPGYENEIETILEDIGLH